MRLAVALLAGLLFGASLPPWPVSDGAWPLGLCGAALLFAALAGEGPRQRLLTGSAAGIGLYAPGLLWMVEFHAVGYVVAVLVETALLGAAVLLVPAERTRGLVFPAALVLLEGVRARWPLGGIPLAGIDLGQVGGPLAPAARLGGRLLLVALVGAAGVAISLLARRKVLVGLMTLASIALVVIVGAAAPDGSPRGRLVVAAVQGGGDRGIRAVTRLPRPLPISELRASRGLRPPVDLVVWPEGALEVEGSLEGSPADEAVASLARRLDATVVAGIVEDAGPGRFRNAAVVWAPSGERVSRYDKVHRVPFGEYIPARRFLERLVDLSAVPNDAVAGRKPGVVETRVGRIGVVISYEVFYPERSRAAVRTGGRLLLVPTNTSSFRMGQVPAEELAAARLRALEIGRWVVQAAPTGYSAIVDQRGRVVARSRLGQAAVLQRTVEARTGNTVASWLGTAPWVATAGICVLGAWARLWKRGRVISPSRGTAARAHLWAPDGSTSQARSSGPTQ